MPSRSPLLCVLWLLITLGGISFAQEPGPAGQVEQAQEPVGAVEPAPDESSPLDGQITGMSAAEQQRFAQLDGRKTQEFSNVDLAEYLALRAKAGRTGEATRNPREDVATFARRSLGQEYRLNAVSFDLAESDCMVFVNRMLALAVASDWQSYAMMTERIRHKDGILEYRNRNFFPLGDWLPNNGWLLDDVTKDLGPADNKPAETFTHMLMPKKFEEYPAAPGSRYKRVIFKGYDEQAGRAEIRRSFYIPAAFVYQVEPYLLGGDVVMVLRRAPGGHLRCDHMGLIARDAGTASLVHSIPPQAIEEPLLPFLTRCPWIAGLKFLRLRENADEIVAQEIQRLAGSVPVLAPGDQDVKNHRLRASRLAPTAQE